jgi:hypothetical protein
MIGNWLPRDVHTYYQMGNNSFNCGVNSSTILDHQSLGHLSCILKWWITKRGVHELVTSVCGKGSKTQSLLVAENIVWFEASKEGWVH